MPVRLNIWASKAFSRNSILKALEPFENKRIAVEADSDVNPKTWHAPYPCWCHPKSVSELRDNGSKDDNRTYRYVNGVKLNSVSVKRYSPPLLIIGNPFEY
jgi:hypothetical protein